jgi:hypothetical protein
MVFMELLIAASRRERRPANAKARVTVGSSTFKLRIGHSNDRRQLFFLSAAIVVRTSGPNPVVDKNNRQNV